MTVEEAIKTIIQQNKKLLGLITDAIGEGDIKHDELEALVKTNKTEISKLKSIIDAFGLENTSIAQNNDLLTLRMVLKSGSRYESIYRIKESIVALGDNYKSLYDLANTVKSFIESTDTADKTINTWKEIENFLAGVEDSDSFLTIINNVSQEVTNLSDRVDDEIELLRTDIDTLISDRLDALKVKDVDGISIVKDEDGVIKVHLSSSQNGTQVTEPFYDANYGAIRTFFLLDKQNAITADNKNYVYNGFRDIDHNAINLVQEKALAKHLDEVNADIQSNTDQITVLSGQLLILTTGAKVTGGCSPGTIYKATQTNVTITGTFSASDANLIPKKMILLFGSKEIASSENSKTVRFVESVNMTTNNRTYSVRAEVDPNNTGSITVLTANCSFNARYPIYYGFGNSADEVLTSGTKVGATTTASRTYTATNNKTVDCYFYILVPTDIGTPTKFSMGGAPANMNTTSETLNGVAYKVIRSGGIYAPGAKVEIAAS
ncbi:MAG: hypothetical protein KNU04_gp29 [crAssphage sp. isolate ctbg_1]|uniref:Uncharacterized protein n=1 Tax=crAssphage sp. isolate ctbg_1 TaxID=2989854 RepID=A0A345MSZ6_9CAUD|nr:MAG: hypothetical protein KNU04_gp29 [crAssphage sp. isolate ctbg_1]AXH74496.1 MAG: hypothetical protein [crAssphage sp. isolate ctbg_1]